MKSLHWLFMLVGILLAIPLVHAQSSGHMRLLAVSDTDEGRVGGVADLFLEIKPGSGRVFLETFPLTRIDTQISTRFAKEIACDHADIDCSQFDFFYTITADSSIVAGPSAGAAISVLTYSLITGTSLDAKTAITGTINSGGLIGPVGGVKEKVEAAAKAGFKKVLVPIVDVAIEDNETNETTNVEELEKKHNVDVIEVVALEDALYEFTGKRISESATEVQVNENYEKTMKELAVQLCSRSDQLQKETRFLKTDNETGRVKENAMNLTKKGDGAFALKLYYSAASYCFGANVEFNYWKLSATDLTNRDLLQKIRNLREQVREFDRIMEDERIRTITDLETYMVVKERLVEATEFLDKVSEGPINTSENIRNLAYATERLNSAKSWSEFLQSYGKEYDLNEGVIQDACKKKISEVEERLQYVQLYLPESLENTRKQVEYAYDNLHQRNYELCLFQASKAKANVDTILSVFGVRSDKVDTVIEQKSTVVARNLVEETQKGVFPILGYSYFEYAGSLRKSDPFSSLLYLSYALELSDLDIYFRDTSGKKQDLPIRFDQSKLMILGAGIAIGFVAGMLAMRLTRQKRKTPAKLPLPGKKR